ncbi:HmuY family protein [Marinobacter zhejiangensis]|uniref:HmuY protein n=1 Tax=Marinobacter zhejiangensis TaxID=488535 RepID=A0A1I4TNN7_9GAMM|nr:HmuY family protein [Marinobacter zhejiangensis]SFM78241.1 HmuY protein [Marinobacter zhejiangensis]
MSKVRWIATLALGSAVLSGCGGGSDNTIAGDSGAGAGTGTDGGVFTAVIDASAYDSRVYFNLSTGEVVALTDAQAAASSDWHLALKRYDIQLNGGASGPGTVVAALGAGQDDFYDGSGEPIANVFVNATAESELEHLLADFSAPASWSSDVVVSTLGDDWYVYDYTNGNISANDANGYLVRSAEGDSYARLQVTDFTFPTRTGEGVTSFEMAFDVQVAGSSQFTSAATFNGSIPPEGGELCFDFDSNATVDCMASNSWDIVLGFSGRSLYLRTNSGPSGSGDGGAFGPFDWPELSAYTSATTDPGGSNLTSLYAADSTGGVFVENSWYAYGVAGGHQLWPNYRVYLVDVDSNDGSSPVYALQMTGYYGGSDGNGASGQPVIRWREVTLMEGE